MLNRHKIKVIVISDIDDVEMYLKYWQELISTRETSHSLSLHSKTYSKDLADW
jgi:hypothetical protein